MEAEVSANYHGDDGLSMGTYGVIALIVVLVIIICLVCAIGGSLMTSSMSVDRNDSLRADMVREEAARINAQAVLDGR